MYGEVIIGVNMLFNYAILSFANKVGTVEVSRGRLLLASFIGAVPVTFFPTSIIAIIGSFFGMTICAFGKAFMLWRKSVFIVLIGAVFAGGLLTVFQDQLHALSGKSSVLLYALIAFIALYLFRKKWFDARAVRRASELTAESTLSIWGTDIPLTVFVDSGNSCTEPLSGAPVHFVSVQAVLASIPDELKEPLFSWDSTGPSTLSHFPERYLTDLRLIQLLTVQGRSWAVGCKFDDWIIKGGKSLKRGYIVLTKEDQRYPNGAEAILHVSAMDIVIGERGTAHAA